METCPREPDSKVLDLVAEHLRGAQRVLFITGAGISAESGLPTYRGVGGLYNDCDTEDGMPVETALGGEMLRTRPDICWKYLLQVAMACAGAGPNRSHHRIAELEQRLPHVCVLTQNIDGYHRDAGSRNLIEIHGNNRSLTCMAGCGYAGSALPYSPERYAHLPPRCPSCGGVLRPEVVLFGEMLPERAVAHLHQELAEAFDLTFLIGTTAVFPYIAQPVLLAARQGLPTVEINPGSTELSDLVRYRFPCRAGATLDGLCARLD